MNNILQKIIDHKKNEVNQLKQLSHYENRFYSAISKMPKLVNIIAEIKCKSPSAGQIAGTINISKQAGLYESAGAAAISVVTDHKFFGGSLEMIPTIKKSVQIPVLQKDFIIDRVQIYQSKLSGVDALLLIARILPAQTLRSFVTLCIHLNIEPLVEVYNSADLKKALTTSTRVIGVNARDLDTFAIDIPAACGLIRKIPNRIVKIGLSGVSKPEDVQQFRNAGAKAVLIGTALMKSKNANQTIINLMK